MLYLESTIFAHTQHTSNMFNIVSLLVPMHSSLSFLSTADVFESDKPDQFIQTIYLYNIEDSTMSIDLNRHCQMAGDSHFNVNNYKK